MFTIGFNGKTSSGSDISEANSRDVCLLFKGILFKGAISCFWYVLIKFWKVVKKNRKVVIEHQGHQPQAGTSVQELILKLFSLQLQEPFLLSDDITNCPKDVPDDVTNSPLRRPAFQST